VASTAPLAKITDALAAQMRAFAARERAATAGVCYPWIVKSTGVVNHFYVYCMDAATASPTQACTLP